MFLGEGKVDTIKVVEFLSVNNVLREHNKMKEEIKIPETFVEYTM